MGTKEPPGGGLGGGGPTGRFRTGLGSGALPGSVAAPSGVLSWTDCVKQAAHRLLEALRISLARCHQMTYTNYLSAYDHKAHSAFGVVEVS